MLTKYAADTIIKLQTKCKQVTNIKGEKHEQLFWRINTKNEKFP